MTKYMMVFASVGSAISIFLLGLWWLLSKLGYGLLWTHGAFTSIALLFWPSSFFLMATENQSAATSLQIVLISIIANALLYGLLGLVVWYGIYRHRWVLYVTAGVVAVVWYKLLNL